MHLDCEEVALGSSFDFFTILPSKFIGLSTSDDQH